MQKEKLRQILDGYPEDVDVDSLMEKLYLFQKIDNAERELANGEGIPDEAIEKRLSQWLK